MPKDVASEPTKPSVFPRPTLVATAAAQEQQGIGTDDEAERIKNVAVEYVLTAKLSKYLKLSPEISVEESNLLAGLKASTVEVICEEPRVRAIRLGNGMKFDDLDVAGDTIYERDFYPQLVRDIRTAHLRVLLLGNSGVGKSTFQFYMLTRFLNPSQFQDIGAAPPTHRIQFGSASPPKVVIRQLPEIDEFQVLFLDECVVHSVSSKAVLKCFDPATTLYFYEPGSTSIEPIRDNHKLSTLATMSPDIKRYKEFRKRARIMYCPVYTKTELLAIGRDMRQPARGFPSDVGDLYSDANISQRFDAFNGIFRYVLPESMEKAFDYLEERDGYLNEMNPKDLIDVDPSTMVQRKAGSFALMYDVGRRPDGERDFFTKAFMYAGPHVATMVRNAYMKKKFDDLLYKVRYADELKKIPPKDNIPWMFEEVVSRYLTTGKGVRWELRRAGNSSVVTSPVVEEKLKGPIKGFPASYAEMKGNTLYRSMMPGFPFCDMMFKNDKGTLVCIQVSWDPNREVKASPFQKYCHAMGLCADEGAFTAEEKRWVKKNVLLLFCPRPRLSSKATLTFEKRCVLRGGDIVRMGEGFTSWIDENGDSS